MSKTATFSRSAPSSRRFFAPLCFGPCRVETLCPETCPAEICFRETKREHRRSPKAFTLVEVALAIGIVSFALLPILGTLSVGLATIHDAKTDTARTQVIAQISSTVLQTPFERIAAFASNSPFYFDHSGRQLETFQGSLFSASLDPSSGNSTTYPGAPSTLGNSAMKVLITVSTVLPGTTNAVSSSHNVLIVPKS